MTLIGWIQIILYCAIIVALVKPLGWYMTRVFNGERTFLSPVLRPVEAALYWVGGVDERREQHWLTYTVAMLLFHVGGFLILYGLMRLHQKITLPYPLLRVCLSPIRRTSVLQHLPSLMPFKLSFSFALIVWVHVSRILLKRES